MKICMYENMLSFFTSIYPPTFLATLYTLCVLMLISKQLVGFASFNASAVTVSLNHTFYFLQLLLKFCTYACIYAEM